MPEHKKVIHTSGRRKTALARVFVSIVDSPEKAKIMINKQDSFVYLQNQRLQREIELPLVVANYKDKVKCNCEAYSGGKSAQAGAIKLAIAKALLEMDESLRAELKKYRLLTRDPRMKERKKAGLKSARAPKQSSKR
jgi:small subunit ribosomal protein S9